jgi:hydroxymethylpyrimidine/phosphomethylpyrimidine kinase
VTAVLVIAGTDSSGGAGLVRDVRTLAHFGTAALCAVTAVTAQSDAQLLAVEVLRPELVRAQIAAALGRGTVTAVKTGMLATRATVEVVADALAARDSPPLVVDPVLAASSGGELLDVAGRQALIEHLLPRATLLTPNIPEAAALLGSRPGSSEEELLEQARALCARGARAVLLKGGHAQGTQAVDWLVSRNGSVQRFSAPRAAVRMRGTGCALASAVAAGLATGLALEPACERAKRHVTDLLQACATRVNQHGGHSL